MNGACNGNFFLSQPPWALGRGQKVKYHLISITKSISKIFIPNPACVLTNERYKIYQTRFSFCHLDHASGAGLGALGCPRGQKIIGGTMGGWGQKDFFQKFNQIWCVSYLHE